MYWTYSKINQAYFLMWHDQVIKIEIDRDVAADISKDLGIAAP